MTPTEYAKAKQDLYSLAHSLGSNGRKQAALVTALHDIELSIFEPKDCIRQMLSVFYDGLAYGNWPWIDNGVDSLTSAKQE